MSIVTLQVGQCGNQLGFSFFQAVHDDLVSETDDWDMSLEEKLGVFFSRRRQMSRGLREPEWAARAVLIDMEPKVVQDCLSVTRSWDNNWCYSTRRQFVRQRGSGNNWAYGYNTHGPQVYEDILELCRKEVEACDYFGGFLLLHSAAGGTGSGLGSYLTDRLRGDFPRSNIINNVVFPHSSGEVVVQSYNTVLTMAHLLGGSASGSDGVICMHNDHTYRMCTEMMHKPRPSLGDFNQLMAKDLALALLPSRVYSQSSKATGKDILGSFKSRLCAHPAFKLLDIKSVPQMPKEVIEYSSHSWSSIIKHLYQMQLSGNALDLGLDWNLSPNHTNHKRINKAVGMELILRGEGAGEFLRHGVHEQQQGSKDVASTGIASLRALRKSRSPDGDTSSPTLGNGVLGPFSNPKLFAAWSGPENLVVRYCDRERAKGVLGGYERIGTLVSNSRAHIPALEKMAVKAQDMWRAQAYVHQYAQHGVDNDEFKNCMVRIEHVLEDYRSL